MGIIPVKFGKNPLSVFIGDVKEKMLMNA